MDWLELFVCSFFGFVCFCCFCFCLFAPFRVFRPLPSLSFSMTYCYGELKSMLQFLPTHHFPRRFSTQVIGEHSIHQSPSSLQLLMLTMCVFMAGLFVFQTCLSGQSLCTKESSSQLLASPCLLKCCYFKRLSNSSHWYKIQVHAQFLASLIRRSYQAADICMHLDILCNLRKKHTGWCSRQSTLQTLKLCPSGFINASIFITHGWKDAPNIFTLWKFI